MPAGSELLTPPVCSVNLGGAGQRVPQAELKAARYIGALFCPLGIKVPHSTSCRGVAVVYGKYRVSPHPSPEPAHPELFPAVPSRGQRLVSVGQTDHPAFQLAVIEAAVVG